MKLKIKEISYKSFKDMHNDLKPGDIIKYYYAKSGVISFEIVCKKYTNHLEGISIKECFNHSLFERLRIDKYDFENTKKIIYEI